VLPEQPREASSQGAPRARGSSRGCTQERAGGRLPMIRPSPPRAPRAPCTTGRRTHVHAKALLARTAFLASTARPLPGTGRSAVSRYSRGVSCAARRHACGRAPLRCLARSAQLYNTRQALAAHPRALAGRRALCGSQAAPPHGRHHAELHAAALGAFKRVGRAPPLVAREFTLRTRRHRSALAHAAGPGERGAPARLPAVLLQREVEVAEQPQERGREVRQLRLAALACPRAARQRHRSGRSDDRVLRPHNKRQIEPSRCLRPGASAQGVETKQRCARAAADRRRRAQRKLRSSDQA